MKFEHHTIPSPEETAIPRLGTPTIPSPLAKGLFVAGEDVVLVDIGRHGCSEEGGPRAAFELAGPREMLFFDPAKVKCGVVTCGGLCPGVNDVIRAIVMEAHHYYRVPSIMGFRYGLEGFIPEHGHDLMHLTPERVAPIHEFGGTILGTSRGPQRPGDIVDALERLNISVLFMVGGDGTMRAVERIVAEIGERGLRMAVVGIPKTIDNDIEFVAPSFGFDSAVDKAAEAIRCAHTEALGVHNGIGLVKLMGRDSGFIAAQSALALKEVNFVLVPEADFDLHGEKGFLEALRRRLAARGHAVIVVAEGAGQRHCAQTGRRDASGNVVLGDICGLLRKEIKTFFAERGTSITLKYIDPSYIIRSIPANSNDRVYCGFLGQNAVHAALSGRTGMIVSRWNGRYVHIPLHLVARKRKIIDTGSQYWRTVLESPGQPDVLKK